MSLIIPDDSYVTLEEANKYHAIRGSYDAWNALSDEAKIRRLVSASDFLDVNYHFLNEKIDPSQPREFPRKQTGGGDASGVPAQVKTAVFELALQPDLNQNEAQKMESVRVGPVSVNYKTESAVSGNANRFTYVKSLLDLFLDKRSGYGYAQMLRG
ncbi:hypothetical protein FHQ28_05635 [Pasteurellaceae bacterium USgator11]|nr:hypothetical protein FHQ20_07895 [Pasteurellaceae bacterium USgator41]TNG96477.1 hypothetical protein FHQ19_02070 [Pasteurellaceae bacterium UScroc12]TNH00441.1 hypothetical protein FHQ24_03555 [Pasteurellaceae bacterium UScroc31]TNH01728.1 hypothetical protein FHQ28_05635 [Pasteurellaceae bacterium USgator11]